ncbi:MAG: aromatic amino acid ammonia-lyase, partial [Fimbriimonadales bacterium]
MRLIVLDGDPFSIGDLADIAHRRATVDVGEIGSKRAADSAAVLSSHAASGEAIYGVNTGFGPLKSVAIPSSDLEALQLNLIRSHAVGVGPPLGEPEVRAAMALLAASHLRGSSGVDSSAAKLICELLNNNELPRVPSQGSLGASGDLAPLAHIALFLIENGLKIAPKLGLSLINGTHVHTALAALLTHESVMLAKAADIACAMNLEATLGSRKPFDASVHKLRPHPHQQIAARNLWALTEGSAIMQSHANCGEVQDAYSFRCAPQVHGA